MLFAILIPITILVMYLLWRRSGRGATRLCRGRLDRSAEGAGVLHRCMACGAEVRTADEHPPRVCLREG